MNARKVHIRKNTDIHGNPVQRTPGEYPYSYDQIAVFKTEAFMDTTDAVFSDRMRQWSPEKFAACYLRAFDKDGQIFDPRYAEQIERFLQLYYGIDLELTGIEEGCNFSNGYPYWVFYFKRNEEFRHDHMELTDEDRKALERRR